MQWLQFKCTGCQSVIGETLVGPVPVVYCLDCAQKAKAEDKSLKLTAFEAGLLTEVNDGTKYWRTGLSALASKGLIYRASYANGDFGEITDLGRLVLDEFNQNDYSRIEPHKNRVQLTVVKNTT